MTRVIGGVCSFPWRARVPAPRAGRPMLLGTGDARLRGVHSDYGACEAEKLGAIESCAP